MGIDVSLSLPLQRASMPPPLTIHFDPAYTTHGGPIELAACAGYIFELGAYQAVPEIHLDWRFAPEQPQLWIGLGNFNRDRWDWFNPADPAYMNVGDLAPYLSDTGVLLLEIVVLGDVEAGLDWIRVGPLPQIWHVNAAAPAGGDGTSWATAFTDIQPALAAAAAGDEIWVAAGTYYPGTARADTFALKAEVGLFGGFAGTETSRFDSDGEANLTLLSGDLGVAGDSADNALHVVTGAQGAILDSFTISDGNADDTVDIPSQCGGGMYNYDCTPQVSRCKFTNNHAGFGGGMYNELSNAKVEACTFVSNSAGQGGGLLNRNNSAAEIGNCVFTGNTAAAGGGMGNSNGSTPKVFGCEFRQNDGGDGGALSVMGGDAQIEACTFDTNTGGDGAGVYLLACDAYIRACEFTGNAANALGGGLACDQSSSPVVAECSFVRNSAGWGGGVCSYLGSTPALGNCDFFGNTAANEGGAAFGQYSGNAKFFNCVLSGNSSVYGGAVGSRQDTALQLVNCTLSANAAIYGGALSSRAKSSPLLVNCVLWANSASDSAPVAYNETGCAPVFSYCDITGCGGSGAGWLSALGTDGGGNVDGDPLVLRLPSPGADSTWGTADDDYGDLLQQAGSPLIDAGNNAVLPAQVTVDRLGQPRFADDPATADTGNGTAPLVDLGAYEFQP